METKQTSRISPNPECFYNQPRSLLEILTATSCQCEDCAAERAEYKAKAAAEDKLRARQARQAKKKANCKRCGGGGHISSYAHVQAGRCFACTVTGVIH